MHSPPFLGPGFSSFVSPYRHCVAFLLFHHYRAFPFIHVSGSCFSRMDFINFHARNVQMWWRKRTTTTTTNTGRERGLWSDCVGQADTGRRRSRIFERQTKEREMEKCRRQEGRTIERGWADDNVQEGRCQGELKEGLITGKWIDKWVKVGLKLLILLLVRNFDVKIIWFFSCDFLTFRAGRWIICCQFSCIFNNLQFCLCYAVFLINLSMYIYSKMLYNLINFGTFVRKRNFKIIWVF